MTAPQGFFDTLDTARFGAGWAKPEPSLYPEPKQDFVPYQWKFSEARAFLQQAGGFVDVNYAERRNLICVNPHEGNSYATTTNLVAAYQMVLPHESPRAHHHTPNALRIALEAPAGTYTVVDGTRIEMARGDVLLTPNWSWHGHGNDGADDAYWIDVLDVPLVQHLGPMFFESHPDRVQHVERVERDSPMRLPVLEIARRARDSGVPVTPIHAGDVLASIGIDVLVLSAGTSVGPVRTTASHLYVTLEGSLVTRCGALPPFVSTFGDVTAVPCWREHVLEAQTPVTALRISDAPLLDRLGLLRSEDSSVTSRRRSA